jgi:hypothetical protein
VPKNTSSSSVTSTTPPCTSMGPALHRIDHGPRSPLIARDARRRTSRFVAHGLRDLEHLLVLGHAVRDVGTIVGQEPDGAARELVAHFLLRVRVLARLVIGGGADHPPVLEQQAARIRPSLVGAEISGVQHHGRAGARRDLAAGFAIVVARGRDHARPHGGIALAHADVPRPQRRPLRFPREHTDGVGQLRVRGFDRLPVHALRRDVVPTQAREQDQHEHRQEHRGQHVAARSMRRNRGWKRLVHADAPTVRLVRAG